MENKRLNELNDYSNIFSMYVPIRGRKNKYDDNTFDSLSSIYEFLDSDNFVILIYRGAVQELGSLH
jgi:hypothetical protein